MNCDPDRGTSTPCPPSLAKPTGISAHLFCQEGNITTSTEIKNAKECSTDICGTQGMHPEDIFASINKRLTFLIFNDITIGGISMILGQTFKSHSG